MSFNMEMKDILDDILEDYKNLAPNIDMSEGTLARIAGQVTASALWGVYRAMEHIKRSAFPDTCGPEDLIKFASILGLTISPAEKNSELLTRVLDRMRFPLAGGNRYDYIVWAKSVSVTHGKQWQPENIYAYGDVVKPTDSENPHLYFCSGKGETGEAEPAWPTDSEATVQDGAAQWTTFGTDDTERVQAVSVFPKARGIGTFDIVITSDEDLQEPSSELIEAVRAHIADVCPMMDDDFTVQAPIKNLVNIAFNVPAGTSLDVKNAIKGDVKAYMHSIDISATLYPAPLIAIAIKHDLPAAVLTAPADPVTCWPTGNPAHYQRIWHGNITFSEI
jgi:uncharacterized phage protein gp47/JayE